MNFSLKKLMCFSLCVILLSGISGFSAFAGDDPFSPIWIEEQSKCVHGLHHQPNGPLAVVLFCEDAVGTYLGIIYYDVMGEPAPSHFIRRLPEKERLAFHNTWSLGNRMWQEPIWASDITSYAWGPDGTKLYVATSNIYGSGAFYELDLIRRLHRQIAPQNREATIEEPGSGFVITRIDEKNGRLFYKLVPWDLPPGTDNSEQFIEIER